MADMIGGAAVGAGLKAVQDLLVKGLAFRPTQKSIIEILDMLTPLLEDIERRNNELDRPEDEVERLKIQIRAGRELIDKCIKLRWFNFLIFPWYRDKLRTWNEKLVMLVTVILQAQMARDMQETLCKVREIHMKECVGMGNHGKGSGTPEKPEFTVGLDEPLMKLKNALLKDELPSTLLLTGLGGSGKSTLAKQLCCDDQVIGKFGENIIFVVVSKTHNLKTIVQTIFEHYGPRVPEFQSDEDAINRLRILLRQVASGGSPILLVLDDVWPRSETLVQKFQFQIKDYKILVTSRVAFPSFGTTCILKPLVHEDAVTLFRHYAKLEKNSSNNPDEDLVKKVVENCKGLPLAIKVIATSLSNRPYELWQKIVQELSQGHSILDSNTESLTRLQTMLDILEDNSVIKECFMDLALFPEDKRIPAPALIDMWAELYGLDDDGLEAMSIINKLDSMNLANVLIARKNASDPDNYYYNNHFIVVHGPLRELGIHQSTEEPIEQRKRLIIDINEDKHVWWLREKQQGMMARILSKFLRRGVKQKPQQVPARTLSISTDETCASDWSQMQPAQAEVLILNLQTKQYLFPELMEKMSKLKVLLVTNHGFRPSELCNFELLSSLSNLKRIRLERISVPSFGILKNLKKLSLYMCNTRLAFEKGSILISDAFPNLVDLSIDYCKDMVGLPTGLCDIAPLKNLSITNCHKLSALPQEIGKLENLELLRLSSCTDLAEIPDSIGRLSNLKLVDISNCISLQSLPEEFSNLCNLRNLYMTSCARCELPYSVVKLENLKVVCDEETAASWEAFESMISNLMIEVPKVEVNLNWLPTIRS